jgi:hypothetical protein
MGRVYKRPEIPQLLSIGELYTRDVILNIPKWQREYSWDSEEEVRLLLEDLEEFIASKRDNYLLGSIITYSLPDGSHAVVDGQQRTVTLYTLLVAARDVLENKLSNEYGSVESSPTGLKNLYQNIDGMTRKVSLEVDAKITIPIYMEYGGGNQLLTALAIKTAKPEGILTVSQTNIENAYAKCKNFIQAGFPNALDVANYVQGIVQGTFVVETNVGDQRQARDIFFKMNVRGRALEGADYLKNFMFQKLDDDQYDELSEKWTEMSRALRSADSSRSKLKTPEFFLRNLAIVDKGDKISGDHGVYEYWEAKFLDNPSELGRFLTDIQDKARTFSKIAGNKLIDSNETNKVLAGADFFKGTQYLPVLMAGSKLKNYKYLSQLVSSRYLIYILSQERTQDFESMVPRWAKAIDGLHENASIESIDQITSSVPKLPLDQIRLENLKNSLSDLNVPKDERKMRLVLSTVSLSYEDGLIEMSEFLKKYRRSSHQGFDLDLILNPDEISKVSSRSLDPEHREFFGLGNLALINGQAKHYANKLPQSKEDLYGNDKCVLTRSLSSSPGVGDKVLNGIAKDIRNEVPFDLFKWDLESIRARREFIVERFIHTLPDSLLPQSD